MSEVLKEFCALIYSQGFCFAKIITRKIEWCINENTFQGDSVYPRASVFVFKSQHDIQYITKDLYTCLAGGWPAWQEWVWLVLVHELAWLRILKQQHFKCLFLMRSNDEWCNFFWWEQCWRWVRSHRAVMSHLCLLIGSYLTITGSFISCLPADL